MNKKSKFQIVIMLVLLIFSGSLGSAAISDCFPHYEKFELLNGLQVYVFEDHRVPQVDVKLTYRVGSMDELPGQTGIAHLLEHVMFLGTEGLPKNRIHSLIKEAGGYCNAETSYDYTAYYAQLLPANKLELAIAIEADRMKNLRLDSDEVQREQGVVLQERRMRIEDNQIISALEKIKGVAFADSPLAHEVIGHSADISALSLSQIQEFYGRYYSPNNAILSVVGDVNPDEVHRLAEKHFGVIQRSDVQRDKWNFPKQTAERRVTEYVSSSAPYLCLYYPVPSGDHEDISAVEFLLEVLLNKPNSRVEQALRNKRGLCSDFYGYVASLPQQGYIAIALIPSQTDYIPELEKGFYAEIQRLITEGVTDQELAAVRKNLLKDILDYTDETVDAANWIVSDALTYYNPDLYRQQLSAYENMTSQKIIEVAKRYFSADQRTVGYIIPKNIEEAGR